MLSKVVKLVDRLPAISDSSNQDSSSQDSAAQQGDTYAQNISLYTRHLYAILIDQTKITADKKGGDKKTEEINHRMAENFSKFEEVRKKIGLKSDKKLKEAE